jgi:hypothetical protein
VVHKSFETSVVPLGFKISKVFPINKQGDRLDPNNYRPILVVLILIKFMGKVVFKRLTAFLVANYFLFSRQYGFFLDRALFVDYLI